MASNEQQSILLMNGDVTCCTMTADMFQRLLRDQQVVVEACSRRCIDGERCDDTTSKYRCFYYGGHAVCGEAYGLFIVTGRTRFITKSSSDAFESVSEMVIYHHLLSMVILLHS